MQDVHPIFMIIIAMLYFIPILHSVLIETMRKWSDQCHYFFKERSQISVLKDNHLDTYVSMS